MSSGITIKRGANINLRGEAEKLITEAQTSKYSALKPDNFFNLVPRLLIKEGDSVAKGSPIFHAKQDPRILFVSPISGVVKEIRRGAKRKILEIVIENIKDSVVKHDVKPLAKMNRVSVIETLLKSGAWPFIIQRPYGIIAEPDIKPKSIYVSTCSTAPLDVDYEFLLKNDKVEFQLGIDVLNMLVDSNLNLTIDANFSGFFENIKGVNIIPVKGPHPAGNVSVQMHNHQPINIGEKVWEVRPEDVANIGKLFSSGQYSAQRTIAVAGSSVIQPQYVKTQIGTEISVLTDISGVDNTINNRYINGNVLSGVSVSDHGFIDFYNNLLTIIPEGNHYRMFGWLPFVDNKIPSLSNTSLSKLFRGKGYEVDTNMNGEERAIVVTGEMEKVFPMNIYPMQLIKACMAGDIEKMEALGIYEVIPEDFGLVDYANTSKIEAQEIIREGIELMIKEVG